MRWGIFHITANGDKWDWVIAAAHLEMCGSFFLSNAIKIRLFAMLIKTTDIFVFFTLIASEKTLGLWFWN